MNKWGFLKNIININTFFEAPGHGSGVVCDSRGFCKQTGAKSCNFEEDREHETCTPTLHRLKHEEPMPKPKPKQIVKIIEKKCKAPLPPPPPKPKTIVKVIKEKCEAPSPPPPPKPKRKVKVIEKKCKAPRAPNPKPAIKTKKVIK